MIEAIVKCCLHCTKPLKGRSDKKFCDDYCRNCFNNARKAQDEDGHYIRAVNSSLLKNRRILQGILSGKEAPATATRDKLSSLGFEFRYLTQIFTNKNGRTYYYCYDYGYLPLENEWLLIVKRKD